MAGMLIFVAYVGGETSAGMELKYELLVVDILLLGP